MAHQTCAADEPGRIRLQYPRGRQPAQLRNGEILTNEQYEANHYDRELANWERARRKNRLSLFALNGGQQLIISIAMTAAMILAAVQVSKGAMTLGDFVLVNAFMMQIFVPLNFLGFVYREMKGSLANIENMFKCWPGIPG